MSPQRSRIFSLGVAILLAMPLSLGSLTGLYLRTSPFIMINAVLSQLTFNVLYFLSVFVMIVSLWRHRWYCMWICPVGIMCDLASKKSHSKIRINKISMFNKIFVITGFMMALLGAPLLSTIDPISIFHSFFDAFRKQHPSVIALKLFGMSFVVAINFAVPHIWCQRLCPLGGLQDMLTSLNRFITKKRTKTSILPTGRRLVLGILLGFGLKLTLHKIVDPISKSQIRPPGALPDEQFKTVCCRCGNCGKVCPTDIIRSSFEPSDIVGLLTPHIEFDTGYCLPECTSCGNVCPSTAIKRFTQQDKQKLIIGIASIQHDKCLLSEHKECDLCYRYCTYDAVEIRSSDSELSAWPEIITDLCVGCGACMVVCPTLAVDIFPV